LIGDLPDHLFYEVQLLSAAFTRLSKIRAAVSNRYSCLLRHNAL
jgi:hypothetical protein